MYQVCVQAFVQVVSVKIGCRKELAASLWSRAKQAGAETAIERRNFGIADDIYAAGLLLAYMAFVPFCEPGSMDGPTLQRCISCQFLCCLEHIMVPCTGTTLHQLLCHAL